jgi:transcriptional regulator with XRE-family HTH domain
MAESHPSAPLIDVRDLGEQLRRRRAAARLTLRQVETELNHVLTASTLSRLENGATPDPANVAPLAAWLGIPLELIAWPGETRDAGAIDLPTAVEVHLRADKNLRPEAAEALAMVFRRLYQDFASGELPLVRSKDDG